MEEVGNQRNETRIGGIYGQGVPAPLEPAVLQRQKPIDHNRRLQLINAVGDISKIFEIYEITADERCLVGQLCQTLLQFRNY